MVPTTRFELARPCEHHPLKVACLPISPRGHNSLETDLLYFLIVPKFKQLETILNKKS